MLMHVLAVHNLALEARHWDTLRVFSYANACFGRTLSSPGGKALGHIESSHMLMHVLAVHNLALEARHWDTLRVFSYANCYGPVVSKLC